MNEQQIERFNTVFPFIILMTFDLYYVTLSYAAPGIYDNSRHMLNAYRIYDIATSFSATKWIDIFSYYDFYQPLTYFISVPFMLIFGKSYTALVLSIVIFWIPLAYYFGVKFIKEFLRVEGSFAGLAIFTILGSGVVISMTKQYMLDFPIFTVLIIFNYYFFKSSFLKNRKESLIVGLILGLGILTKSSFLMLSIPYFAFAIYRTVVKTIKFRGRDNYTAILSNFPQVIVTCLVFGGIWYVINLPHFNYTLPAVSTEAGQNEGDPNPFSIDSLFWYISKTGMYIAYPILALAIYGAWVFKSKIKSRLAYFIVAIATSAFAFVIATITWNKDVRTLMPIVFFIAPFLAIVLKNAFLNEKYKTVILIFMCFLFYQTWAYAKGDIFNFTTKGIMPNQYSVENGVTRPDQNVNDVKSFYTYSRLCAKTPGIKNPPDLNIPVQTTEYTDNLNINVYGKNYIARNDKTLPSDSLLFFKAGVCNDYYLVKYSIKNDSVYFNVINKDIVFDGDKLMLIRTPDNEKNARVDFLNNTCKIPLNGLKSFDIRMRVTYAWKSGQLLKFIYNFYSDKNVGVWEVDLRCLTTGPLEYAYHIELK